MRRVGSYVHFVVELSPFVNSQLACPILKALDAKGPIHLLGLTFYSAMMSDSCVAFKFCTGS